MSLILRDVIIVAGECVVKVREVTGLNKDDTTPYLWCLAGRQPSRLGLNEVKGRKKFSCIWRKMCGPAGVFPFAGNQTSSEHFHQIGLNVAALWTKYKPPGFNLDFRS